MQRQKRKEGENKMKRRMKKITAIFLAAAMTASLAACGSGGENGENGGSSDGGDKITLKFTWWGSQSRHDYTQKMLDAYTEEHPEIEFEAVPAGWDGYFDKLSTQAASGSMPDIVQMDYLYITTYAKNGSLADMQPYIDDGTIDVSGIDENLLNTGKINDTMSGIVLSSSEVAIGYNPDVLKEAGLEEPAADWTWEDFEEMGEKLKDAGVKDAISLDPSYDTNFFNYWVRQHGESLFSDDNKSLGYSDDKLFADWLAMWKSMMDNDVVPTPDEYAQLETLGLEAGPVVTGDAAMTQNWNNYATLVAGTNENIRLTTPPVLSDGDQKGLWLKPGMFLSVSETCEHKEEAAEFIDWFLNSEEANDIMMAERGTPASSTARQQLIDSGEMTEQQTEMFNYIDESQAITGETPAPDPTGMAEINKVFKDVSNTVFYGQQSPEDAAKQFREQAEEILARNN